MVTLVGILPSELMIAPVLNMNSVVPSIIASELKHEKEGAIEIIFEMF